MITKLTLTVEKDLIQRAKEYAKNQGRSLSDLVENYFKLITSQDYPIMQDLPDVVKEMRGSFTAPVDFNYKQVLEDEIKKKHQ